jgi:ribonuclease J
VTCAPTAAPAFASRSCSSRLRGADWLLLEGTTLGAGGDSHGLRSEQEVEEELVALAASGPEKAVVVVASGQNLDRLVSCYRAAKRSGRQLVVDPYQAFVLQKLASLSENIPQFTWDDVRVNFTHHQVEKLKAAGMMDLAHEMGRAARVSSYALGANPGSYLLCARGSWRTTQLLNRIGAANAELVWSMWGGYWNRDNCAVRIWAEHEGVEAHFIHSGGHAWPEDLARLASSIEAKQTVYVHTDA